MEQFRLDFDKIILELEKKNRWKTAADIVLQQWKACPNDLNRLLCAGTQLWYTLLVMDDFKSNPLPPDHIETVPETQLQMELMDVTRYGFQQFDNDPVFNAYFGYMISTMPYFFLDYKGDYLGWEAKGTAMVRRSYSLDPDSPFTEAMYHEQESYSENMSFYHACEKLWSVMTPEQWGGSEVQQYFFRILNGDSFYNDAYPE